MNEYYYELQIIPSSHGELFLDLIFELQTQAIEEIDSTIIVRDAKPLDQMEFGLKEFAKELSGHFQKDITLDIKSFKKKNEDWIKKYQDSVKPIEVGSFYIHPSWEEGRGDLENIKIDPALAFGSGHHETTYSCLEALQKYLKSGQSVVDVGCGSGILSIAAAKLGGIVDMCDTDEVALKSSLDNFILNRAKFNDSWVGSLSDSDKKYDIVIANIIADVLVLINKDIKKSIKQNGYIILSGILDKYFDRVTEKFSDLKLIEKIQNKEWYTLVFAA